MSWLALLKRMDIDMDKESVDMDKESYGILLTWSHSARDYTVSFKIDQHVGARELVEMFHSFAVAIGYSDEIIRKYLKVNE